MPDPSLVISIVESFKHGRWHWRNSVRQRASGPRGFCRSLVCVVFLGSQAIIAAFISIGDLAMI